MAVDTPSHAFQAWIESINIIKISILAKAIYKVNAIPLKLQ